MGKNKAGKKSTLESSKENSFTNPSKKRRVECGIHCRKRTTWAVDNCNTEQIYQEMGVELLSDSSHESASSLAENTPTVCGCAQGNTPLQVPQAPRVLLPCQRDNFSPSSDDCDSLLTPKRSIRRFLGPKYHNDIDGQDHFNNMYDEAILKVFQWLPKFVLASCARVCSRWNRLVMDESLWKRIDLSNKALGPGTLGNVINRGVRILRLAKAEIENPLFTGPTKEIKASSMYRVQYLDLSMAAIGVDTLEQLFSVCTDLKKISLENAELSDNICSYIGENKDLDTLNLCMCRGITANGLVPIMSNCRKLDSINLAWTSLDRNNVMYVTLCLPDSVRKLNISGCRDNITDEDVLQLCRACPYLNELDLSDSTSITCASVHHIADHLTELEHLALSRCYHIASTTFPVLDKIGNLLALDLFGMFREDALQVVRRSMRHIEINKFPFSSIARPTTGIRRTSIWGIRVRDNKV
ncbi:S-phase kinase-associated protein 2-like [Haliotis asinina]|uniref:S-phase kinase-associated protein 2-like n=1 Tax=Haliotis asinina TaxID=109174 RepID=UPI0035322041